MRSAVVGRPPGVRCGACGADHPAGNWFCQGCGRRLDGAAPAVAVAVGRVAGATARPAPARASTPGAGGWAWSWRDGFALLALTVALVAGLFGPPLEREQWRPEALRARFAGQRLPGDAPVADAGGSLPRPPAPPPRPAPPARPGTIGPNGEKVTVWPLLAPSDAGYVWATEGWVTQEFGCSEFWLEPWDAAAGCQFHAGIDVGNWPETPIVAVRAGTVSWAGWRDGYGYTVFLDHGGGIESRYGHLCCAPAVKPGQAVERGERIGLMGATGAAVGSHLHLEVLVDGEAVDPRTVLPNEG